MSSTDPARPVPRPRLVDQLTADRVAVIEAGSGYGKSTLLSQLRLALGIATVQVSFGPPDREPGVFAATLRRGLAAARLSDLLAATDVAEPERWIDRLLDALAARADPVLMVLDDAHHLQDPATVQLLLRLESGLGAPHRLIVAARSLTRVLEPLRGVTGALQLDSGALAFEPAETRELFRVRTGEDISDHDLAIALESTGGWATALVLAAAARRLGAGQAVSGSERDPVAAPLRGILAALDDADRRAVIQLAHLPVLSPELCDAVAGRAGCFESLIDGSLPLARTPSGWWELPGPVAAHLAGLAPAADATLRAAATMYAAEGEELRALRTLLVGGLTEDAAALLSGLDAGRLDDLGFGVVADLVDALGAEALARHPRVLLHLARIAETAHQLDRRRSALAEVDERLAPGGEGEPEPLAELRRELHAEQARDLMWDSRTRTRAGELAREVVANTGPEELTARARALDVLGRLASWFSETGPQPEAERLLRDSARLSRRIGQRTWAAQALVALAGGFYFARCRYEDALGTLGEVLADLPARHRYRAMVQVFRAEVLIEVGEHGLAESALIDMRAVGERTHECWIMAYASWQEAELASYVGDAVRCVRAVDLALGRYRDTWFEEPSGVEFLAQAADYLSRVSEHARALELLGQARARMAETEHLVRVHAAAVLARSGDPAEAERELALALVPAAEPQERWPLLLLRAYVALRRGDRRAVALADEAFSYCRELGHPDGPRLREPAIVAALSSLRPARRTTSQRPPDPAAAWRIGTLGGFVVCDPDGAVVSLPAGRPARLVRALAAHGGAMSSEAAIEALWPDLDPNTGRNRLRNVLSRIRSAAPDLVHRDDQSIRLGPGVEVDADDFERLAQEALREHTAGSGRATGMARAALERHAGEFLPGDLYEEWATPRRERLRLVLLELLDLLIAQAEAADDADEAARLLDRAVAVEPQDEERYRHLARLLTSQGRTGSALGVLRRGRAALRGAGLSVSDAFAADERSLR